MNLIVNTFIKPFKIKLLAVFLLPSQLLFAGDLQHVISLAHTQDATYQAAIHKFSSDKENYTQALSRFMPTISYKYSDSDTTQTVIESANFLSPPGKDDFNTIDQGLTINQPLFDMEIWNRFQLSKSTVSRAESELLTAEQDLLLRSSEAYFLVLEREDQLDTIRDEKIALNKHFTTAQQKKRAGLGRTVDVDTAEARYLEAVAKEIELESRLLDSHYALAEITGSVMENLSRLSEKVDYQLPSPANVGWWIEKANTLNPGIIAKEQALQEAKHEVSARKTKHYPTVNLTYTNGNIDSQESIFSGASDIDSQRIELRVDVPLFQGFYVKSRVQQALSDSYRSQDELRRLQREVERNVRDAYQRINASIMQIKALTRSVEAQKRMLHLKTKGYNAGRYTLLEVLDAQKDFASQQQGRTKARYDYVLNILRLKAAAGIITMQDIQYVNHWLTIS
jgi:outer membrane protein